MTHRTVRFLPGLAGLLLVLCAGAQEDSELPPGYIPLFTEAQIRNASPQTQPRMRETERINLQAWTRRQQNRSVGNVSAEDPAEPAAEPVSRAPRAAPRRKIYRWVDADGRINFGDNPPGKAAREVKVHRSDPPSPGLTGSRENSGAARARRGSDTD